MSAKRIKTKGGKWYKKLRDKYRLVISNEDTFEEEFSFRLSRLNVFIVTGTIVILLIVATTFLIAFTPLREYIPGYTDVNLRKHMIHLEKVADSLQTVFDQKNQYIQKIRDIIEGREIPEDTSKTQVPSEANLNIDYKRSPEDSILREEYTSANSYDLFYNEAGESAGSLSSRSNFHFFNPLKGIITSEFNVLTKHYGIDIVSKQNEAIKATLDGTVFLSEWTIQTGYVIALQHKGNFISVYKHNSVLLKQEGNVVKAGEPIAIIGESGELSTGPHLHFELWYNGTPVNPKDYIAF